ncbi:MAG TPA: hypothetical protein VIG46_01520 [Candidatus Baltobacteraceae bacterium]|jgi:hypothetical protein
MDVAIDRPVDGLTDEQADFHLDVLTDAVRAAETYWKNFLWKRSHEAYAPSAMLIERYAARYGAGGVEELWSGWFATLTSDEYFVVLAGVDMERIGERYGRSSHRSP